MTFNDPATPRSLLATRRSGKPRDLIAPGPDADQLHEILTIAARTPDHGKLFPWRFVTITDREAFAALLHKAAEGAADAPAPAALDLFARQSPTLVAVLSTPVRGHKIPLWEQELSAGAVCMNLLHAAHASGFIGGWLSGWASYQESVVTALGGSEGDRIAGFVFIGTPSGELTERPRPEYDEVCRFWP